VSPVKYELGFYIPEDDILHSDRRESLKSCLSTVVRLLADVGILECPKATPKARGQRSEIKVDTS
jgi:hypothetical protein